MTKLQTNNKAKNSCKGLVVGDIQSGKTANMTALIAQAADNGFHVFIILSGIIDSLRQQTSERIYGDLASNGSTSFHWKNLENPSLKNNNYNLNVIDLGKGSKNKVLIIHEIAVFTRLSNLLAAVQPLMTNHVVQAGIVHVALRLGQVLKDVMHQPVIGHGEHVEHRLLFKVQTDQSKTKRFFVEKVSRGNFREITIS